MGVRAEKLQDLIRTLDEKEDSRVCDVEDRNMRVEIEDKLEECLRKDEITWRQCSRALWLKEGHQNTKFSYCMAKPSKKNGLFGSSCN